MWPFGDDEGIIFGSDKKEWIVSTDRYDLLLVMKQIATYYILDYIGSVVLQKFKESLKSGQLVTETMRAVIYNDVEFAVPN